MDLKIENTSVGTVLNAKRAYTAQKVINSALDGTTFIQTTGGAITRYIIDVYCETKAKRDILDEANNDGVLLTLVLDANTSVYGYVEEETITWKEWRDGHGVGHFTLIKQ